MRRNVLPLLIYLRLVPSTFEQQKALPFRFRATEWTQPEMVLLDMLYRALRVDKRRVGTEGTNDLTHLEARGAEWSDQISRDRSALQ